MNGKNGEMALHAVSPFSHFTPTSVLPGTSYRHPPERAVLLQGPLAYPEYARQFPVRQETFSHEYRPGSLLHVGQHSFQILKSLEKDFDVRVFLLYEMVIHGFLFKG